jgi:hypothetical protein
MPDLNEVLKENGYNPYSMPDPDFVPLAIVQKNKYGKFERAGVISDFVKFPPGLQRQEPIPQTQDGAVSFYSSSTQKMEASIGLNFLQNILSRLKVASLNIGITDNTFSQVELSYPNVKSDSVDIVHIEEYIDSPAYPKTTDILAKNVSYVINDILKSNSFNIAFHSGETASSSTAVDLLKECLKTNGAITITHESDNAITFEGPTYQTFALRVRPFWTLGVGKDRKFYFGAQPPSFWNFFGIYKGGRSYRSGGSSSGSSHESLTRKNNSLAESVVFPESSFYSFT